MSDATDDLFESGEDRASIAHQLGVEAAISQGRFESRAQPGAGTSSLPPISSLANPTLHCGLCGRVDFIANIVAGRCCAKDDIEASAALD